MKIKILIVFFLAACVLLHKQMLGAIAKWAIDANCDCQFDYRSLYWENGEFVFSDVVISDPTFHAHIKKASLDFDWSQFPKKWKGHITLNRPHVSVMKLRPLPERKESWFDFTISAVNGTLEWEGLARFSFDQNHLVLDWEGTGVILAFGAESIEADLKSFQAHLLQPWFPYGQISDGTVTGRIHIGPDQKPLSANLKVDELALGWSNSWIQEMKGVISYNADVGLKWELEGMGNAQDKEFPFACKGRGFFTSQWIETEIHFADALCKVAGNENWDFECARLNSEHLTLIQAPLSFLWPEVSQWVLTRGTLNGKGKFAFTEWNVQFDAENVCLSNEQLEFACQKAIGNLSQIGGEIALAANDFDARLAGKWDDWKGDIRLFSALFSLRGGWDGEKFPLVIEKGTLDDFEWTGEGWIDPHLDFAFSCQGTWTVFDRKIPFYCPQLSKQGSEYAFDFRLARNTWDLLRVAGNANGKELCFNEKSHLLGAPLHFVPHSIDATVQLSRKHLLAADPFFQEFGIDLTSLPLQDNTTVRFQYTEGTPILSANSDAFAFHATQAADIWTIDLTSDLTLRAHVQKEGSAKGRGKWRGFEVEFEGKITPSLRGEFALSKIRFDLSQVDWIKMEGTVEGQGHLIYEGDIEADFDLMASSLKINGYGVENEGPIHLNYSSECGALFRGLNLHGPFDCIVDLLEYDLKQSHWIFHNSQMHLPGSFLTHPFLKFLDPDLQLNFTADLDFASDFSTFTCFMREGTIPFAGHSHHIENLNLQWEHGKCKAALHYLSHRHYLQLHVGEKMAGRFVLGEEETPMTIDWEYQDQLAIQSIEGSFGGVEASFHAESEDTLVGSARINFTELSEIIPAKIAEVFEEIEMGKGFELKGRLKMEENIPSFHGILCGKALELFSFQFRTLMAQVDINPTLVHIYDVKISDSAGMMKIDEILMEGDEERPWTIEIPQLTIIDMRPSLLQKPGGTVGPISPFVVREFTLTDFKGLLDEGKTWTAQGQLHFINSYKREESVFDLPANVFSRIVGLDLELLIPVRGNLTFELKEGFFLLKELSDAFSEAERSEFFLETDPPPFMDLDGNLQINLKMKQFVLFKITESLLISIEGKLNDPEFHLRKKRFFGFL